MKLKKAMMSLAAATAAGLCISAYAANPEKGQSGTLNLTDPVTNASVVASGDTMTVVGGSWNEAPTVEGGWMVIDCDAATSNQFTATSATTGAVVQCDFDLQVAPVPLSLRPASAAGAQTAFCVCTNTTAGGAMFFCALVNNVWKSFTGAVPLVDSEYSLRVTFDYKNGKYVKFSVKTSGDYVDLYDATPTNWFATGVASGVTGVREYCFVGTGNVKSFAMAQSDVEAEQVPIDIGGGGDPVVITIPEEVIATYGGSPAAAATALATVQDNGATLLDNYVLFGTKTAGEVSEGLKPVSRMASTSTDGSIQLDFDNLVANKVENATVTYKLYGKANSSASWSGLEPIVTTTNPAELVIPSDTACTVFKVEVTVDYE